MYGRKILPPTNDPLAYAKALQAQWEQQRPPTQAYQGGSVSQTTGLPGQAQGPTINPLSVANLVNNQTGLGGFLAAQANPYATSADIPLAAYESGLVGAPEYGGALAGFATEGSLGLPAGETVAALSPAAEAAGFAPAVTGGFSGVAPAAASAAPVVDAGIATGAAEAAAAEAAAAGALGAEGGLLAGAGALGPLALGALALYATGSLFDWW